MSNRILYSNDVNMTTTAQFM